MPSSLDPPARGEEINKPSRADNDGIEYTDDVCEGGRYIFEVNEIKCYRVWRRCGEKSVGGSNN